MNSSLITSATPEPVKHLTYETMTTVSPTYEEMRTLLHRIYIARNIALREDTIHECLRQIDKWFPAESGMN